MVLRTFISLFRSVDDGWITKRMQDSFALCRVFKKNGICTEIEEQGGQSNSSDVSLLIHERSSQLLAAGGLHYNDHCGTETLSPENIPRASSSSCLQDDLEEEEKDDSWMQFITDDPWSSSTTPLINGTAGEIDLSQSHLAFTT